MLAIGTPLPPYILLCTLNTTLHTAVEIVLAYIRTTLEIVLADTLHQHVCIQMCICDDHLSTETTFQFLDWSL